MDISNMNNIESRVQSYWTKRAHNFNIVRKNELNSSISERWREEIVHFLPEGKVLQILDVGTGSGILSIAALKLGAGHAVGTDLDPCAIDATYENMEVNGISKDKYEVMIGNIIDDKEVQDKVGYGCYDIVVANILADVLVPLTPVIVNQLKDGGIYVTSGIIEDKEETVKAAVEAAGLTVLEVHHQGEWVSVTARKETKA